MPEPTIIDTFTISEDGKSITCKRCKRTSHNPNDVERHYCGHCHVCHDDLWPPARQWWIEHPEQWLRWIEHPEPVMRWNYSVQGVHTHVRVFVNGAKCGELCFRNEEFTVFRQFYPTILYVSE